MDAIQFALLGHPINVDHVADLIARLRPSLGSDRVNGHKESLTKVFEWSSTFAASEDLIVPRPDGSQLRGKLIICTFLPEHAHSPRQMSAAYQKTREGVRLAKALGAKIVGLGGFTSIVGGAQEDRLPSEFGVAATSGNSLTAALAIEQIKRLLNRLRWSPAGQTVAVLGATGDIGRACTQAVLQSLAPRRLLLIARNKVKLERFRHQLLTSTANHNDEQSAHAQPGFPLVPVTGVLDLAAPGPQIDIQVTAEAKDAAQAQLIIAATSAAAPLLVESDLAPGTIVCDIGYPNTLAYSAEPRPDVLAFHGGLAQAPFELPIGHYTLLPAANLLHGCFSETIVLAMAQRYESYSLGQGRITLERMEAIYDLARSFGFQPAPFYRGDKPLTEGTFEAFSAYTSAVKEDR